MISRPADLEHGERYGALTVLKKSERNTYRVGCVCGMRMWASKSQLRKGTLTECVRCRKVK